MSTAEYQNGALIGVNDNRLRSFNLEISYQDQWVSLNDHARYVVTSEGLGNSQTTRKRETVTSPFYDGEYEVHSVKENVKETIGVYVLGQSQSMLTENILLLVDAFEQSVYNLRLTLDEHREVWICNSADYSIDRSQVNAHN